MAKKRTRDIGAEILEGVRELKRGEIGRVVTFPPVAEARMPAPELLTYFAAEKQAGALLVALGLAGAGLAAYLLAARSPLRAMAWPLLVFVLIQLAIGAVLLLRTDAQVAALEEGLRTDRAATVTPELARMERVNRSFRVFKALEVVLILAGLALALLLRRNPTWSAVGMGLLVEAAIMLVFDLFAEHRALVYTRWLESLTGGS